MDAQYPFCEVSEIMRLSIEARLRLLTHAFAKNKLSKFQRDRCIRLAQILQDGHDAMKDKLAEETIREEEPLPKRTRKVAQRPGP